jgi:hypothetical protein
MVGTVEMVGTVGTETATAAEMETETEETVADHDFVRSAVACSSAR